MVIQFSLVQVHELETITEVGEPKEAICEAAEKLDVQLLVLGSYGRGVIQRYEMIYG